MAGKRQRLRKKQLDVLDDLFGGQMDEAEVLEKHKVAASTFRNWLGYGEFVEEYNFRMEAAKRQGKLIVAKYIPAAAARLVELAGSDKGETSRKACLDIMSMKLGHEQIDDSRDDADGEADEGVFIDGEAASRILRALAE